MSSSPPDKLGFREKLYYGFGDLGSCIFWCSFMNNLALFHTDVFGISAAAAGTIVTISKFWDAANDPMVGMLADRTRTRWGRYRPYLLWFSVPLCIAAVLMFTTPDYGTTAKLIWAWVTYNLVMTLYTLVNIPYTALLGTISPDAHQRASVSTFKFACAFGAGIIVSATFLPMTRILGDGSPQRGWQLAALVVSTLALPFFFLCFRGTRERVTPTVREKTPLRRDLLDLLGNRPWMIVVGITLAWVFFVSVRATMNKHYLKYFVLSPSAPECTADFGPFGSYTLNFETLGAWFDTTSQFASLIGVLIVATFVRRVEKRRNFLFWFTASVIFIAAPYWFTREQVELILVFNVLGSLSSAPLCVLIWAMYSDTAEYSEWKNNRQAAGLVFSASTLAQQIGWGIGPGLTLFALDHLGFVANVEQSDSVLRGLVMMVTLVPAAFGVLSMIGILFYPLNDRRVGEMSAELKVRRGTAG